LPEKARRELSAAGKKNHAGTILLPHPVKQKIWDAFVALSLANLCFIKVGFDLLSDQDRFFNKLQVTTPMLLALALNIGGFAALTWLLMQWLRQVRSGWLRLPFHLLFIFLLLFPVDFIRLKFFSIADYQIVAFLKQPVVIIGGVAVFSLLVWKHERISRIAAVVVGIFSPLTFFLFVKIALVILGVTQLKECLVPATFPPTVSVHEGQPRVVWIIFDEMDYRLVFEQRPADLQLPEFDRLRQQSLSATSAYPPGDATIISMPALILGRLISGVSMADSCDLSMTFADTGETASWIGQPSVFSGARALGVNTALVGWYIPYDRMLGGALNFCEWYPYPPFEPARAETFGGNVRQQISSLGETIHLRKLFGDIHQNSLLTSLSLVTNSTYGLILLHLPAPHRPGVYLPEKNKFTAFGMPKTTGYFNNLVLADHELGALRTAMESSGEWEKTWIILSADHSWRESKLYDNRRDYRVPFLVKPPGAGEPAAYPQKFNTVLTHDLILAILRGEITNRQNVPAWLDTHGTQSSPITGGRLE
jgi:hypothetical protein